MALVMSLSGIIRGIQQVEKLEVFERIADDLGLPDPARSSLGPAPTRISPGYPAGGYSLRLPSVIRP